MRALRYGQVATPTSDPNVVTVSGTCFITKEPYSITVPRAGLEAWLAGELIQYALPEISRDEREFLISGTSPEGFDRMRRGEP